MQSKIARCLYLAAIVFLAAFTSFFCACFSLGVEDMTEYNTRFPYAYAVNNDFSTEEIEMSKMVGTDDDSSSSSGSDSTDLSDLNQMVDVANYRAIAVKAAEKTSIISELAVYLYYEGTETVTLNYGIYKSTSLPKSDDAGFTIADIEKSDNSEAYEDEAIVQPPIAASDDILAAGSVSLSAGWTGIYKVLSSKITLRSGDTDEYLIIVFYENNDFQVEKSSEEVDVDDGNGGTIKVTQYTYTFTEYTANDVSFSFDKTLLYVAE